MILISTRLYVYVTILACFIFTAYCDDPPLKQTNLLMIMFDDLRPELSIYGRNHMITPNFERLAARSVVFDNAHAQISVCNPSRDSLLTGLRPDTIGTYGFQSSFRPFLTFPTRLASAGYQTASYGKIAHWESQDRHIWNHDHWNGDWYEYQQYEWRIMNSSTMPDKTRPEEHFRDYIFASRTIETLKKLAEMKKYFMLAVGFKLPHLAVHVPYKYFEMYKDRRSGWELSKKELRFPPSAPAISYRCCADSALKFMENEGASPSKNRVRIGDINEGFTEKMHDELMIGYAAAITFVDKQLGRVLDAVDQLELWGNLTVVLTADHGMHNGEKGIWEKWSMFDESTRVPLMIAHPQSPYKGQHYTAPVELLDVFPTLNDILGAPKFEKSKYCRPAGPNVELPEVVCHNLQGKSLARAVLGTVWDNSPKGKKVSAKMSQPRKPKKKPSKSLFSLRTNNRMLLQSNSTSIAGAEHFTKVGGQSYVDRGTVDATATAGILTTNSVQFDKRFSITQSWRCSPKGIAIANKNQPIRNSSSSSFGDGINLKERRVSMWVDCDKTDLNPDTLSIMGYSIRTSDFRYTAWFFYDRVRARPLTDPAPFEEELYDHRDEKLSDFTHREMVNIVYRASMGATVTGLRQQLVRFLKEEVVFRGPFK